MTQERIVFCQKLQQKLPGLTRTVYPGDLGKKIFEQISQEAWSLWVSQQTMLINEYRLDPLSSEAQEFLRKEMIKFLFAKDIDNKD